jgi:hypothetical protein
MDTCRVLLSESQVFHKLSVRLKWELICRKYALPIISVVVLLCDLYGTRIHGRFKDILNAENNV